jgi:hypothetical protein
LAIGGDVRRFASHKSGVFFLGLNKGSLLLGGRQILEWFLFLDELIVMKKYEEISLAALYL